MKKLILLILTISMTFALAACGSEKNETEEISGAIGPGNGNISVIEEDKQEVFFGKVSKVVGNEIIVMLAKIPGPEEDVPNDNNGSADIPIGRGDGVDAVPATRIGETGTAMEIELTGDSVTLIIPAGVPIYNMGQETTLSSLSKGNIISFGVDNWENLNLKYISIVE
ncbi:MAG: hypothetical protein CVV02_05260 [Firmicutes bacterium HGW-Firmicutes-7]|nr:MAG: hypothetical protein CVV02_05260 [Firmicutes bacterium HGW-Firmicutes-7]